MSDIPATPEAPTQAQDEAPTPTSNASDQARIRKERREAKIRGGSAARLKKITGLNGGRGDFDTPIQKTSSDSSHPDSKDIHGSNHSSQPQEFYSCSPKNGNSSSFITAQTPPIKAHDEALRLMMRESNFVNSVHPNSINNNDPFTTASPTGLLDIGSINDDTFSTAEDPMMKMLQQMMAGSPSGGGSAGLNSIPNLANNQEETSTTSHQALIWRVAHAIMAISLGLYIAVITQFTGTKLDRERSLMDYNNFQGSSLLSISTSKNFFYLFITIELIMLGSRYFLYKEDTKPGGIMGMLVNFLQEPIRGYVLLLLRYMNIWKVLSQDALLCVFVLGAYAWWKTDLIVI